MNIKTVTLPILVLTSCAMGPSISANRVGAPIAISYEVKDAPSEKRLYVSFRNDAKKPICIGAENWPSNGLLLNDGKSVSLNIDGKVMPLKAEQDYCPKCSIRVKPQSVSTAFFKYESFDIPESLTTSEKKLSFHPVGYQCR